MNEKMYRQVAIERLSSPEQLDQVMRVTSFRMVFALSAVFLVLALSIIWGLFGNIVTTSAGDGLIMRRGSLLNVVARGDGVVVDLRCKPGDKVRANEVIATIAQPELGERLRATEEAIEEAKRQRAQDLDMQNNSSRFQAEALQRERENIGLQIIQLKERSKNSEDQIKAEEVLLSKGLVTKLQVQSANQGLADLKQQILDLEVKAKQDTAQEYNLKAQPGQSDRTAQSRIQSLERELSGLHQQLSTAEKVVSPFSGEVLEVKVFPGSVVALNQALLSVQPDEPTLEVVGYIPSGDAKDLRTGMEAQVSPLNVKREEYGFMKGETVYIADYPSTPEALMRNFENQTLVQALNSGGPVTEVHAVLKLNPATFSGFAWSTSQGPREKLSSGTICSIQIVTKRQRPITLLFPYLRKKVGLT